MSGLPACCIDFVTMTDIWAFSLVVAELPLIESRLKIGNTLIPLLRHRAQKPSRT